MFALALFIAKISFGQHMLRGEDGKKSFFSLKQQTAWSSVGKHFGAAIIVRLGKGNK